jgi:hypothetical protein
MSRINGNDTKMKKMAYIELKNEIPIRIFRTKKSAMFYNARLATDSNLNSKIIPFSRVDAVRMIRSTIFNIQGGRCLWCGKLLTRDSAQMHEQISRSKGGEISLENSIILCYNCHQGSRDSAHGNRRLRFGEEDGNSNSN